MSGHHAVPSTKTITTRMAASGRNIPPKGNTNNVATMLAAAKKNKPVSRVANARELRAKFTELQESPDGADLDPLTIPKCVECSHCGWPVYPRESKVATKKTFARAGIDRGSKKEEEAKRRAAIQAALDAGEEIGEDLLSPQGGPAPGAASEDSRDTVERLSDQLQELEDQRQELERKLEELENQTKSLVEERDRLQEDLDDATDRIEYMTEAEERWRDKVAKARIENDRLLQELERSSFVSSDREGGLIVSLLDARNLRETIATMKRRRALMLVNVEKELHKRQDVDEVKTVLNAWKTCIMKAAYERKLDDLDARRRKEVAELQQQLQTDRVHAVALQAHVDQLRGKLKQAAHRLVERSMSSKAWPFAQGHALRAWCGIHPSLVLENELERTRQKLQETEDALEEAKQRNDVLAGELEAMTAERDQLIVRCDELIAETEYIKGEAGLDDESIARKKAAAKAYEEEWQRRLKEVQDQVDEWKEKYTNDTEELAKQLKAVQSKLAITQHALDATTIRPGSTADPDAHRVVPNGQGILCCGCLKQIVLRDVTPLPPKNAMSASTPDLESARRAFFKKGLGGRLQQDDKFQNMIWEDRIDPYHLTRLSAEPEFQVIREPSSPKVDSLAPKGLPALKSKGLVSLKSSMRDFRPRVFR